MTRLNTILLVAVGATWGAVYPLTAVVLRELEPTALVAGRAAFAAAVFVPIAWRHGQLRHVRDRPAAVVVACLLQSTVPLLLMTLGQEHVSAGLAGIILSSQALWAAMMTWAIARTGSKHELIGVLLGLGGVALIFAKSLNSASTTVIAGLALLGAAVFFAGGSVYIERIIPEVPPLATAALAMALTATALAPFGAATRPSIPSAGVTVRLAVLGIITTGSALVAFYALIRRVGAIRANLAGYLAPAFALVYGAIFLDDAFTPTALIGLALIITGSYLAATQSPGENTHPRHRDRTITIGPARSDRPQQGDPHSAPRRRLRGPTR